MDADVQKCPGLGRLKVYGDQDFDVSGWFQVMIVTMLPQLLKREIK